ncbi:uncharacterized protein DSM5745_01297 [Aspergillus mulundensis]|uniref:F-box domain-containing protein n=1 Tax=Aspergillus mulundensis TaxID=1810919 RepID=A0A3D8T5Z4_9EURO|nr:hypothetical protein DSM5745_01297 [Aspergillus mulundensis]RDW93975.1 hypothetical protein DSM5745_01297 [Aspergillus mulundensis]
MYSAALVDDVWYLVIAILNEHAPTPAQTPEKSHGRHPHFNDLLALSSASKGLRNILAPRLFRTLDLHNNNKSASSVLAVSQGSVARHVKELRYTITCAPDETFETLYPPALDHMLSNLAHFPNLKKSSMIFPQDPTNALIWDEIWESANDAFVDDPDEAGDEEKVTPWRGVMASSYRALASNHDTKTDQPHPSPTSRSNFRKLAFSLSNLPLVTISAFSTPSFQSFLSQLNSFALSLPHLDNGAGWHINTQEIYAGFTENLPFWFFDHLASAESFSFDPRETGILGAWHDRYRFDIGVFQASMPRLRRLELGNVVVCEELSEFCIRHKETLESVTLRACHAGVGPSMSWADLFTAIVAASPSRLKEFRVLYGPGDEGALEFREEWRGEPWVEQALAKMNRDPEARVYVYGSLDDKYGFRRVGWEMVYRRFLSGEDERAFAEVMTVIKRNQGAE